MATQGRAIQASFEAARQAIDVSLSLAGMLMFWMGLMQIAQAAGIKDHVNAGRALGTPEPEGQGPTPPVADVVDLVVVRTPVRQRRGRSMTNQKCVP
jgi:hypothetical protein